MTKPKKRDDDGFDSNRMREESKAKIQAENQQIAEDKEITSFRGLPQAGETREQLLDRIRAMREEKPPVIEAPVFRSEGLQKEFEAEQAAGRAAVAKAEAEQAKYREIWAKEAAEGEKNPRPDDRSLSGESKPG